MVYPKIFGQNKRFKREYLQIPSNVGKAHSLKRKKKKKKKEKKNIRHIKMIWNKMRLTTIPINATHFRTHLFSLTYPSSEQFTGVLFPRLQLEYDQT